MQRRTRLKTFICSVVATLIHRGKITFGILGSIESPYGVGIIGLRTVWCCRQDTSGRFYCVEYIQLLYFSVAGIQFDSLSVLVYRCM